MGSAPSHIHRQPFRLLPRVRGAVRMSLDQSSLGFGSYKTHGRRVRERERIPLSVTFGKGFPRRIVRERMHARAGV